MKGNQAKENQAVYMDLGAKAMTMSSAKIIM